MKLRNATYHGIEVAPDPLESDSELSEIDWDELELLRLEYEGASSSRRARGVGRRRRLPPTRSSIIKRTSKFTLGALRKLAPKPVIQVFDISKLNLKPHVESIAAKPGSKSQAYDQTSEDARLSLKAEHRSCQKGLIVIKPLSLLVSRLSCYRPSLESAPPAYGSPQVWASSRQALYETLPYFKKPQGGCHQNDRHVYAFLFDGAAHHREYMDEDIIIARATGGMEWDEYGNMVQKRNQSMNDANPQAIQTDIDHYNPLIIICGNRHTGAHVFVPHRYCVLGWFKPVFTWAEKSKGKAGMTWTTIKIRFERLNGKETPWHRPVRRSELAYTNLTRPLPANTQTCPACHRQYPQIYLEMWTCLNEMCRLFWQTRNGREAHSDQLHFDPAFLALRKPWPCEQAPYDLRPSLPNVGRAVGDNVTYVSTRGVVCPVCGKCNSRYLFSKWVCDNPACDWDGFQPQHMPIVPAALHLPWESLGSGPSLARNRHEPGVDVAVTYCQGYKVCTYTFPGINGRFIHAIANTDINAEYQGPDDMFLAVQTLNLPLERRRFKRQLGAAPKERYRKRARMNQTSLKSAENTVDMATSTSATEAIGDGDFMVAFSANYGMPYKFIASGATQSFTDAPWPIKACRSRLNWGRRALAVDDGQADFNELLVFAYMEGQKIDYHDDGEEGLGACVASLSLGCKARMSLRVKAKHYVGCSKSGVLTRDRPLPASHGGVRVYEKRLAAWRALQDMGVDVKDHAQLQARLKALPHELGIYEWRNKKAPDLLTVTLSHGDIMIMDGSEVQRYLEHRVVPEGLLRFSMTCRDILPGHLREDEMPTYQVLPDDFGYDGPRLASRR